MVADGPGDFWIFVEGGGSQTLLACVTSRGAEAHRAGPTSPQSVTARAAQAGLARLARGACQAAGADPARCGAVVAAHGAASAGSTCGAFFPLLKKALGQAGMSCPLLLTNDLVPLLLGGAGHGSLAVAVAGTGTGYGARSAAGDWARASGCEYLLSDEGGGFDIGMSGLRAAIRAIDGRGAPTALLPLAQQWCGAGARDTAERLCQKVYVPGVKPVVASFAPVVLEAAAYDEAAAAIAAASAGELATGVWSVILSARCSAPDTRVLLAGSLLTEHEILARGVREELGGRVGRDNIGTIPDGWLADGFDRLRRAWLSGDDVIQRLGRAFPVKADVP